MPELSSNDFILISTGHNFIGRLLQRALNVQRLVNNWVRPH